MVDYQLSGGSGMYTVKQVAKLAGVSVRTLHYYDEIGLLTPTAVGDNSYRYYDDDGLMRLQQILFYRELDFDLRQIKEILDSPSFDIVSALQEHRLALQAKIEQLQRLIKTVDSTLHHQIGDVNVSEKKKMFEGFNAEKQKEYEQEAMRRYGEASVKETIQRWNSYPEVRKQQIMEEGRDVYLDLVDAMPTGPASERTQAILVRWHEHLRYFYEPSIEVLGGLGQTYAADPDFRATFTAIHPDLPDFLAQAIAVYVDKLETAWLEQELGILQE